jgi:2-iminobutanoate/2-iminopropanoate deaminase
VLTLVRRLVQPSVPTSTAEPSVLDRVRLGKLAVISRGFNRMPKKKTGSHRESLQLKPVHAPSVLNEAYDYARPSSFSRGMRVDLGEFAMVFLSGTASIDEKGRSIHTGDFRAQIRRTFANLTALLASEGLNWKNIVRTTCYLRDIERDYDAFNQERTAFYKSQGLGVPPASTAVQAILCRPELLVEIEAIAITRLEKPHVAQKA